MSPLSKRHCTQPRQLESFFPRRHFRTPNSVPFMDSIRKRSMQILCQQSSPPHTLEIKPTYRTTIMAVLGLVYQQLPVS